MKLGFIVSIESCTTQLSHIGLNIYHDESETRYDPMHNSALNRLDLVRSIEILS